MGKPAARIGDMHMCPMVTPGLPPIPHVGGAITGPGCPTVLIGGQPAAVMGDMCICTGPPDTIVLGSSGVMIGGKPAARLGDQCAHGGSIVLGCMTVLIGETGSGGPAGSSAAMVANAKAAAGGLANMPKQALQNVKQSAAPQLDVTITQALALKNAAEAGTALVHNAQTCPVCAQKMKG